MKSIHIPILIVAIISFFVFPASGEEEKTNTFSSLPDRGYKIEEFVPGDWRLRSQTRSESGKLILLELIKQSPPEEEALMDRAMIVLFRSEPNSPFLRIGTNTVMLHCLDCSGASGSSTFSFRGEILEIRTQSGTHSSWDQSRYSFRRQADNGRIRLTGKDIKSGQYDETTRLSINFLTQRAILSKPKSPEERRSFSQPPIYFEDINRNGAEPWEQAIWALFL